MKSFFSCVDAALVVPQPLQHLAIRERAKAVGGAIVFYGSEEAKTLGAQKYMRAKIKRVSGVDGIVFFSLHQFRHGASFNWDLLCECLDRNLEVHFAREGLSLRSRDDLGRFFALIYSVDYTVRRDQSDLHEKLLQNSAAVRVDFDSVP